MALTEKQKEQIREEEALRHEVRRSMSHKCSSPRRYRGFWLGLIAGVVGSLLFGRLFCMGGGYSAKCAYKHGMGTHEMPHKEMPAQQK
jgi:hypothetical protein